MYSIDLVRGLDVYSVDVPGDGRGSDPTPEVSPARSVIDQAAAAAVPMGLLGGAIALTIALRRRSRTR